MDVIGVGFPLLFWKCASVDWVCKQKAAQHSFPKVDDTLLFPPWLSHVFPFGKLLLCIKLDSFASCSSVQLRYPMTLRLQTQSMVATSPESFMSWRRWRWLSTVMCRSVYEIMMAVLCPNIIIWYSMYEYDILCMDTLWVWGISWWFQSMMNKISHLN